MRRQPHCPSRRAFGPRSDPGDFDGRGVRRQLPKAHRSAAPTVVVVQVENGSSQ
jgi:hypothetical protein